MFQSTAHWKSGPIHSAVVMVARHKLKWSKDTIVMVNLSCCQSNQLPADITFKLLCQSVCLRMQFPHIYTQAEHGCVPIMRLLVWIFHDPSVFVRYFRNIQIINRQRACVIKGGTHKTTTKHTPEWSTPPTHVFGLMGHIHLCPVHSLMKGRFCFCSSTWNKKKKTNKSRKPQ